MSRQSKIPDAARKPFGKAGVSSESWGSKIAKHYSDEALFYLIDLGAVLLLFPLAWRSTIPGLTVVGLGGWYYFRFLKPYRAGRSSFTRHAYAVALGVFVFGFVAFWPFIIAPKPVYVTVQESENPLRSKMHFLQSGGKTLGSVFAVSDPARKALLSLLGPHLPSWVRVLDQSYSGSGSFYKFPVLDHFLVDSKSPGDVTWQRSLYFPFNIVLRSVELYPPESSVLRLDLQGGEFPPKRSQMVFGLSGRAESCLLDFGYTQYPDTVPWNAVQIQPQVAGAMERYIAFLDIGLECFAEGRTEEAMRALDGAAAVVPSSTLEAARLAALQYLVTCYCLHGNVGELQSLPLLHNAYDLFLLSRADPRFSERDPLTNWLRQTLLDGYDRWSWVFFDRLSQLWTIPHLDSKSESYFDALKRRLGPMSYRELLQFVKSESLSPAELFYVRARVSGRVQTRMLSCSASPIGNRGAKITGHIAYIDDRAAVRDWAAELADVSRSALPIIEHIDSQLSRRGELKADPFNAQVLRILRDELPRVADHWNEEGEEFFRVLLKSYPESPELRSLYAGAQVMENKISSASVEKGMASEWWKQEYFLWFSLWSMDAILEIEHLKHPERRDGPVAKGDVRGQLAKFGLDAFTKDMGGRGRTFLPGLACLAWYAQTFNLKAKELLSQEFEAKTKMSLERYIDNLESLQPH
jgi:hypothetical protein